MEMIHTVTEAVLIAFSVGAILGAIAAAHFQSKRSTSPAKDKAKF